MTNKQWARNRACLLDFDSLVFTPYQVASKQISSRTNEFNDDSIHSASCLRSGHSERESVHTPFEMRGLIIHFSLFRRLMIAM